MSQAATLYASSIWSGQTASRGFSPLSDVQARNLRNLLREDSQKSYYSALISLADALQAVDRGFYSWTSVKLYYLTYFLLRAHLAIDGVVLFHLGSSPKWCEAKSGNVPETPKGPKGQLGKDTSHKMAFNVFYERYPGNILLSQEIATKRPDLWLQEVREYFNYKQSKFTEPLCPPHFLFVEKHGIRRSLEAYFSDSSYSYAFDPDHAILAYPIAMIGLVRGHFSENDLQPMTQADSDAILAYLRDRHGPVSIAKRLVSEK